MDTQIAAFIDQYTNESFNGDISNDVVSGFNEDEQHLTTPWEEFCHVADAWARHAQASNGFGDI